MMIMVTAITCVRCGCVCRVISTCGSLTLSSANNGCDNIAVCYVNLLIFISFTLHLLLFHFVADCYILHEL